MSVFSSSYPVAGHPTAAPWKLVWRHAYVLEYESLVTGECMFMCRITHTECFFFLDVGCDSCFIPKLAVLNDLSA